MRQGHHNALAEKDTTRVMIRDAMNGITKIGENMTAFNKAGGVMKGWEVSEDFETGECKGCGDVHGSPDSDYCSEICERENS